MAYRKVKKPDRFTNPREVGVVAKMAKFYALEPLDQIAFDMEMKWGVDRLPRIVGVDLAVRYGKAKAELDAAIDADDEVLVAKKSKKMISGWKIMDAEAERLGLPAEAKQSLNGNSRSPVYCCCCLYIYYSRSPPVGGAREPWRRPLGALRCHCEIKLSK